MRDRHVPGLWLIASLVILLATSVPDKMANAQNVNKLVNQPVNQNTNLLQNPGFEGTYTAFNGDTTRKMAAGWSPWNIGPKDGDPSFVNVTPEYRLADNPARIRTPSGAQEYFTFFATHVAGVYQQVAVQPGSKLRFSAYLNVWSTNNDDPSRSDNPGEVKLQVGIDPNGGTDGGAAGIVWSNETEFYDKYEQLSVEATSAASTVTVFVRSAPKQPVKNNHVYVDDAELVVTSAAPTGTSAPTNAPVASATLTPFPQPTATPTDTPQGPTPRPSPTREGTIPPPANTNTPGGPTDTPAPTATPIIEVTQPTGAPTDTPAPGFPTSTSLPGPTSTSIPGFPAQITYTVNYGDTVYDLAIKFQSSVDAIITANNLNEEGLIFVGQQLIIPVPQVPTAIPPTAAPLPTSRPPYGPPTPPLTGRTLNGIGTYIVQPGDDLFRIAAIYNITPGALARLNGIVNASQIRVGQVLVVPGPGNNVGGRPPVYPGPIGYRFTHVVQPGENLFRISLQYNVTLDALMRANGIYNPNYVYVGQTLYIP